MLKTNEWMNEWTLNVNIVILYSSHLAIWASGVERGRDVICSVRFVPVTLQFCAQINKMAAIQKYLLFFKCDVESLRYM